MTPCEKNGYKAGDKFRVLSDWCGFEKGAIIKLLKDDGSSSPLFIGRNTEFNRANGKEGAYMSLSNVIPFVESNDAELEVGNDRSDGLFMDKQEQDVPLTQQLAEAVKKRDKYGSKADKWAARFADQAAEVSRIAEELERDIEDITGLPCKVGEAGLPDQKFTINLDTSAILERIDEIVKEIIGDEKRHDIESGSSAAWDQSGLPETAIPKDVDPDDPTTWKEGDVVECFAIGDSSDNRNLSLGERYSIQEMDLDDPRTRGELFRVDGWWPGLYTGTKFRFVRRPSEG